MTWRSQAACAHLDPEIFFPHATSPRGRVTNQSKATAMTVCAGCGVTVACLEYALSTPMSQDFGIWGGTTRAMRVKIRMQQTPTAPIQDEVCTKSLQEAVKM